MIKLLRINHYIKNIIIFVPLIFSQKISDPKACVETLIIFAAFCLISSAVYILNDLIDIQKDKKHPTKCKRPIASGEISIKKAIVTLCILAVISIALAANLNPQCILVIIGYFILNIFYSLVLKNMALIDTVCIAAGFILRVLSGCYAIQVVPSPLIILLTFFLSMFFTFSKRKLELEFQGQDCRTSLKEFTPNLLNQFITINAILSISFYFTYVLDDKTIARTGTDLLYISVIPFALVLFRLIFLITIGAKHCDPVNFIYKDRMTQVLIGLFAATLFIILK